MKPEEVSQAIVRRVSEVFVGQAETLELLLAALGARAHVLLEGPPGTAKTLLAWAVAKSVGLRFKRVQLTPDLMPSDLIGTSVWLPSDSRFEFREGPVFTDVLLADELNRAPPKTQAALLEAMQERQVTFDGTTRPLGPSFWVVATQNPLEQEGTYPLPESQLDRFAMKVSIGYPSAADERAILQAHRDGGEALDRLREKQGAAVSIAELDMYWAQVRAIHVDDSLIDYAQAIVRATRAQPDLSWGAGPRASIALLRCAQGLAAVRARAYVIPDDVRELVVPVLEHRIRLAPEAQLAGLSARAILGRIVAAVAVPARHAGVA